MSNQTQSFGAVVLTVSDEIKTKSNGREFQTVVVRFTDGKLTGKEYFAQRTLGVSKDGRVKSAVQVGDKVRALLSIVDNKPFFELSTSMVDSADDIMSALS